MGKPFIVLLTLLLLGGCARPGDSDVITHVTTRLDRFTDAPAGSTFALLGDQQQLGSSEWRRLGKRVAQHLEKKGLRQVASPDDADYAVWFAYGGGDVKASTEIPPAFGQQGLMVTPEILEETPPYRIRRSSSIYGSAAYVDPFEAVARAARFARLVLLDRQQSIARQQLVPVYEGSAWSAGGSAALQADMPYIIDAMFIDWPDTQGSDRSRTVRRQ